MTLTSEHWALANRFDLFICSVLRGLVILQRVAQQRTDVIFPKFRYTTEAIIMERAENNTGEEVEARSGAWPPFNRP